MNPEAFSLITNESIKRWLKMQGMVIIGPHYSDDEGRDINRAQDGVYDPNLDRIEQDDIQKNLDALLAVLEVILEDRNEFRRFCRSPLEYIRLKYNLVTGREPLPDLDWLLPMLEGVEIDSKVNKPQGVIAELKKLFKREG